VDPYSIIDPNSMGWWASSLGVKQALFEIQFDRMYLVQEIVVNWKFRPKEVVVSVLNQEKKWVGVLEEECDGDLHIFITPTEILGV